MLIGEDSTGPAVIELTNGRISAVRRAGAETERGVPVVDAADYLVAPGCIDMHTHGGDGAQAIDGRASDISRMAMFFAKHGVTSFLATIGGGGDSIEAGIGAVRAFIEQDSPTGAGCLGIHLEGPFINAECLGAFRAESVAAPDVDLLMRYVALSGGRIRLITLAPEVPGADAVIRAAAELGIRCSAGHSAASAENMAHAVDLGVRGTTHTFNAMRPLHHRAPGLLGIALTDPRVVTEVIADGLHVHPAVVALLAAAKGRTGVALVTDSVGPAGLADGDYDFEEQQIRLTAGAARLADGTLAGSVLTMDRAVQNFANFTGSTWEQACVAATAVPAGALDLAGSKGRIAPGMDADLIAVDADRGIVWTMVNGRLVYRR